MRETERADLRDIDALGAAAVEGRPPAAHAGPLARRDDFRLDPGAVGVWYGSLHHRLPIVSRELYVGMAAGSHNGRARTSLANNAPDLHTNVFDDLVRRRNCLP